jgi:hypothetical protein
MCNPFQGDGRGNRNLILINTHTRLSCQPNTFHSQGFAMKARIVEHLGQSAIILPALVREGLVANDRAKVRMAALQAAVQHTYDPATPPADLSAECRAAGLDPLSIQSLIGDARTSAGGTVVVPGLTDLMSALENDIGVMIHAVEADDASASKIATDRLAAIKKQFPIRNEIETGQVTQMIAVPSGDADSLHRLIMDLHKTLNNLAASCAEDVVAGAHVHSLGPDDRPLVEAFMRGLDSTRALKFNHPGLDTTAARAGPRLIIQNDIGETDAHVLVISIENLAVTVTLTDVHRARAEFFRGLFDHFAIHWRGLDRESAKAPGDVGDFFLVTGRYEAETVAQQLAFLESVGAMIVFLIDWNKARKSLRSLVANSDAVRVLDWAARHRVGHRAFLELGGSDLVGTAVRHARPARIGFGEQLGAVLGRQGAVDFLKTVLGICTDGRLHDTNVRLVRDAIEAELVRHLQRTDDALLSIVIRQAGLAQQIAALIARHLADRQLGRVNSSAILMARAKRMEEKANQVAIEALREIARLGGSTTIGQLVTAAEQAINDLQQAAFIASLMPREVTSRALISLADLCATAIACAETAVSGLDAATVVSEGKRVDGEDAFASTARLVDLEHAANVAERTITSLVFCGDLDWKSALSILELGRALERATDQMAAIGPLLHTHVMADLSA